MDRPGFRTSPAPQWKQRKRRPSKTRVRNANSFHPSCEVMRNKRVIIQVRVRTINAIDLRALAWTQFFGRIQAPGAGQQPLPAQHFVNSGDTTGEAVGGIEERGVGVSNLRGEN